MAFQVTLERDGHDQPWGFRLQGGVDVGVPLSIQRVLVGTPAEGVLRKNDVIVKISHTDTRGLGHQAAADLFTNAGNQIRLLIKRAGVQPSPAAAKENSPQPTVSGGVALPGMASPTTASPEPPRLSPSIETSPKILSELGPGSAMHLKMQVDHITGAKEPMPPPDAQQAKASEFVLKQKVTGTLQQIQNSQQQSQSPVPRVESPIPPIRPASSPIPTPNMQMSPPIQMSPPLKVGAGAKQVYNNPINLYSSENVAEVARLNQTGQTGLNPTSPPGARLVNPTNKPPKHWAGKGGLPQKYDPEQSATWQVIHELENCQLITEHGAQESKVYTINNPRQVLLTPNKDFNPQQSATWRALQESDTPAVDPEKVKNYSSLREHDPVYAEVYSAPKLMQHAPYAEVQPPQDFPSVNISEQMFINNINDNKSNIAPAPISASALTPAHALISAPAPSSASYMSNPAPQSKSSLLQQQVKPPAPLSALSPSTPVTRQAARSPVAEFLPPSRGGVQRAPEDQPPRGDQVSAVREAALAEPRPSKNPHSFMRQHSGIPLYETNSIGGRRRISQSASFNKVMQEVIGE